jgi:hypothetical protein
MYIANVITPPPGFSITVTPNSFTIAPGATATFNVTVAALSGTAFAQWQHGSVTWTSFTTADTRVVVNVAVRRIQLRAPPVVRLRTSTASVLQPFPVEMGAAGYVPTVYALAPPTVYNTSISIQQNDPNGYT